MSETISPAAAEPGVAAVSPLPKVTVFTSAPGPTLSPLHSTFFIVMSLGLYGVLVLVWGTACAGLLRARAG